VVDGSLPEYSNCMNKYVNGSVASEYVLKKRILPVAKKHGPSMVAFPFHNGEKVLLNEPGLTPSARNALDEGTLHFYKYRCNTKAQDNHNLVKKSLYLFQVSLFPLFEYEFALSNFA
jgi:hypothetical protein